MFPKQPVRLAILLTMNTDHLHTETNWTSLTGTVLSGGYELEDLIEAEPSSGTFKVRVLGDRFLQAVARIYQTDAESAARQLAVWESARSLKHANLIAPLGAGQLSAESADLVYVVLSRADESLSGVLVERALSREEAGEVLTSSARALTELHSAGFVHGCLSPEQVLAVGELIKLPTDCIRIRGQAPAIALTKPKFLAPESDGENTSTEADVWCLGATLFETLTQKAAGSTSRDQAASLPAPFNHVVQACLHPDPASRCTLTDVLAIYRGDIKPKATSVQQEAAPRALAGPVVVPADKPAPIPEAPVEAKAPVPATDLPVPKPVKVFIAPPPISEPITPAGAKPDAKTGPTESSSVESFRPSSQRRASRIDEPEEKAPPSRRLWIYVALAALVLLVILWAARRKDVTHTPERAKSAQDSSWQTRTLSPDGTTVNTSTASAQKAPARVPPSAPAAATVKGTHQVHERHLNEPVAVRKVLPSNGKSTLWRVVLFTYNKEADAANRVSSLKAQHPNLSPSVFLPNGHGGPYLVVAGGRMSRDEAGKLRKRAVSAGLPHDSYIQNYNQ